jgi:hypothetical protein
LRQLVSKGVGLLGLQLAHGSRGGCWWWWRRRRDYRLLGKWR